MENLFKKFIDENYKGAGFEVEEIKEDEINLFCYLKSPENYDVPVLILNKKTKKITPEILPPFTDDSAAKTIYRNNNFRQFKKPN